MKQFLGLAPTHAVCAPRDDMLGRAETDRSERRHPATARAPPRQAGMVTPLLPRSGSMLAPIADSLESGAHYLIYRLYVNTNYVDRARRSAKASASRRAKSLGTRPDGGRPGDRSAMP